MSGVTLASLRGLEGLTQRQLAEELNVSPSAIAMYETGERTPSLHLAKRIAQYFKVPVEAIIFGHGAHDEQASQATDEQAATSELPKTG